MALNFDEVIKNEAFKNIEPEKIHAIIQMSEEIKGKNMQEVMAVFTKYSKVLSGGKPISAAERDLMIKVVLEQMDEEERKKYESVIKMINLMNQ